MALIYIKGQNAPIEVTKEQGDEIARIKMTGKASEGIQIGTLTTTVGDVRSIVGDPDTVAEYTDEQAKAFELALAGRSFEKFCYDVGYMIKNEKYPEGAVVLSRITELNQAKDLNRALENLQERRHYAQKKEHEEKLKSQGLTQCEPYSLNKLRCVFCHPWGIRDWCLVNGRADLVKKYDKLSEQVVMPEF